MCKVTEMCQLCKPNATTTAMLGLFTDSSGCDESCNQSVEEVSGSICGFDMAWINGMGEG